jgi:hypothetical protein
VFEVGMEAAAGKRDVRFQNKGELLG